ncbi:MAG: hypothetical protein JXR37_19125 [Kiritimatiellae bacterium]|nr:hypothetical protein [Kiritimatiellia bacterium]
MLTWATAGASVAQRDVTALIERLGNPFAMRYRAGDAVYRRNVWDMQVFGGRVYLGHGNSSNVGPAPHGGPIDLWVYDPAEFGFASEYLVREEQLDVFRPIGGMLHIPGHDPLESWDYGNFYRLETNGWRQHRTIPNAIHCYDIYGWSNRLWTALGTESGARVGRSADDGDTWTSLSAGSSRAFSLFELGSSLYACSYYNRIYEYNGTAFTQCSGINFFPDSGSHSIPLVTRSRKFLGRLVYIGGDRVNDHQWVPFGLFTAARVDQAQKVTLPNAGLPWDILVEDGFCYILTSLEPAGGPGSGAYTNTVLRSGDLETWEELFCFHTPTFARSFERHDGDFYFGLGCNEDWIPAETGDILKLARQHTDAGSPTLALTAPADGVALVASAHILLHADAAGTNGSEVARVEFFGGSSKIGEATQVPFEAVWDCSAEGRHAVWAVATDEQGRQAVSEPARVHVFAAGTRSVACNDLAWFAGQPNARITAYTTPSAGTQTNHGPLVDFLTGSPLAATLSVEGGGGIQADQGAHPALGTDAHTVFDGIVDCAGVISYDEHDLVLRFSGLAADLLYELVLYSDRAGASYIDANARYHYSTLSNAAAFVNAAGSGVRIETNAAPADTAVYNAGWNAIGGLVSRFKAIQPVPGSDLVLTLKRDAGQAFYPYANALMLRGYTPTATQTLVAAGSAWRFRKGTAEASTPPTAWRGGGYADIAGTGAPFRHTNTVETGTCCYRARVWLTD